MNRVIKFRGQDVNGFWHYGYFSKDYLGTCYITTLDGVDTSIVVESTVGQFTGFKDKKGIDVFEGDQFKKNGVDKIYTVTFTDGAYYATWECISNRLSWTNIDIEVIGNIHESEVQDDRK